MADWAESFMSGLNFGQGVRQRKRDNEHRAREEGRADRALSQKDAELAQKIQAEADEMRVRKEIAGEQVGAQLAEHQLRREIAREQVGAQLAEGAANRGHASQLSAAERAARAKEGDANRTLTSQEGAAQRAHAAALNTANNVARDAQLDREIRAMAEGRAAGAEASRGSAALSYANADWLRAEAAKTPPALGAAGNLAMPGAQAAAGGFSPAVEALRAGAGREPIKFGASLAAPQFGGGIEVGTAPGFQGDYDAIAWARQNPGHPKARQILEELGVGK